VPGQELLQWKGNDGKDAEQHLGVVFRKGLGEVQVGEANGHILDGIGGGIHFLDELHHELGVLIVDAVEWL
jgi:hypothetical protein